MVRKTTKIFFFFFSFFCFWFFGFVVLYSLVLCADTMDCLASGKDAGSSCQVEGFHRTFQRNQSARTAQHGSTGQKSSCFRRKKENGVLVFFSCFANFVFVFVFVFFFSFVLLLAECHAFGSNCCQSKQSGQKRSFCRCLGLRKRDYG